MLKRRSSVAAISALLCFRLAFAQQTPDGITLTVVQGNGASNSGRQSHPEIPIVKVEDSTGHPIAGAKVTFEVPSSGAGATFQNGVRTFSTTSGPDGQATALGFTPNRHSGQFNIRVAADYQGRTATTQLMQTNTARASGKNTGLAVILIAAAVGCAVLLFISVQGLFGKK